MGRSVKQIVVMCLLALVVGVLAWRLWPDGGQARQQQRNRDLVRAVQVNDLAAATHLLDEGADPNAQTLPTSLVQRVKYYYFMASNGVKVPPWGHMGDRNQRYSVLEIAAMRGNADMVNVLLSKGADVAHRDRAGDTALDWAETLSGVSRFGPQHSRNYPRIIVLLKAAEARRKAPSPATGRGK